MESLYFELCLTFSISLRQREFISLLQLPMSTYNFLPMARITIRSLFIKLG